MHCNPTHRLGGKKNSERSPTKCHAVDNRSSPIMTTHDDLADSQLSSQLFDIVSSSLEAIQSDWLGRRPRGLSATKAHDVRADDSVAQIE
jgi:hypothetical protein